MKRHATTSRPTASAACASLVAHLREGPLKTLAEIETRAAALASRVGKNDRDAPDELAELVVLAQTAMSQFRRLTRQLKALVDALAAPPGRH
jgi:hypothetical protein